MRLNVLRIVGGALLAVAIVWVLVLGWWQSNDHQPEPGELALYLGALPLALVGGYWLLQSFIEQLKTKPGNGAAAGVPVLDDDPLSRARAATAAAERSFTLQVIETFILAPGGASGAEILAAVESGKRPDPVAELVDGAGFPVFAAMVGEIDVMAVAETLGERQPALTGVLERDDARRALALLEGVLASACEQIVALLGQSVPKLQLQLLCLLPPAWGSRSFPALRAWLGSFDWPQGEDVTLEVRLVPVASEAEAMRQVDEAILQANRNPAADQLILVAGAASAVHQSAVDAWEAGGILFSPRHQDRLIPGEGAAAILLAPALTCAKLPIADSVTISRVNHGLRDKSLRAGGRVSGALIEQLVAGILDVSAVASAEVAAAVLDTDHRAKHLGEMLEGLGAACAHLDPLLDCPATGTVNGAAPPLGGLLALVCACAKVMAAQAPVLCLSNQHETERSVLLARPARAAVDPEPCPT